MRHCQIKSNVTWTDCVGFLYLWETPNFIIFNLSLPSEVFIPYEINGVGFTDTVPHPGFLLDITEDVDEVGLLIGLEIAKSPGKNSLSFVDDAGRSSYSLGFLFTLPVLVL